MANYVFKYPDGTVRNLDYFPLPDDMNSDYKDGTWVLEGKNSVNMEVYHLEFPPVKITFQSDLGSVSYDSDKIPDISLLPEIPKKMGMKGKWNVPINPFREIVVRPTYIPIEYTIRFNDCKGTRIVRFSVVDPPVFPTVRPMDGYTGRWNITEYELRDMDIEAVYEPVKIIFTYDGRTDIQPYSDYVPPTLENKPGYYRRWEIPEEPGHTDISLEPVETPIEYSLSIKMEEDTLVRPFTLKSPPKLPDIPFKKGFKGCWTYFDNNIPENQEIELFYRPIRLTFHCPNGSTMERDYNGENDEGPPEIKGYEWPEYRIGSDDIDLVAQPKMCFALFYVDEKLRFCVPYTVTDRHYLHEMFIRRTVPKLHRRYGRWSRMESGDDSISIYVADYSHRELDLPREKTTINWDLNEVADFIFDYGSIIELDGKEVDLFKTEYSKFTGITNENIGQLISLPFTEWLSREGIPFLDKVDGYGILEKRDGYQMKIDGGFWIGYSKEFDNALEFLQEYDIFFREPVKKRRKVHGLPAWYLVMSVPFDDLEDEEQVWADLFPISRIIPSMKHPESDYSVLREKGDLITLTDEDMRSTMESNLRVIEVFNVTIHPECDFTVLDDGASVSLTSYKGNDAEYEIPFKIRLNHDESQSYSVIEIGIGAFKGNKTLSAVMIPDSVERIADSAFEDCELLEKVLGGQNVKTIGESAFKGCRKLEAKDARTSELSDSEFDEIKPSVENVGVPDQSDSELKMFLASLTEWEMDYLEELCKGGNGDVVLAKHNKKRSMIVLSINEKSTDILDCDTFVDDVGNISEDYVDELRMEIGD